jgi:hypothetical protein
LGDLRMHSSRNLLFEYGFEWNCSEWSAVEFFCDHCN